MRRLLPAVGDKGLRIKDLLDSLEFCMALGGGSMLVERSTLGLRGREPRLHEDVLHDFEAWDVGGYLKRYFEEYDRRCTPTCVRCGMTDDAGMCERKPRLPPLSIPLLASASNDTSTRGQLITYVTRITLPTRLLSDLSTKMPSLTPAPTSGGRTRVMYEIHCR